MNADERLKRLLFSSMISFLVFTGISIWALAYMVHGLNGDIRTINQKLEIFEGATTVDTVIKKRINGELSGNFNEFSENPNTSTPEM